MKHYKNHIVSLLISTVLLCVAGTLHAQVAVNFSPAIYGQTLDGLVYAKIINSAPVNLTAKLTIRIREMKGQHVLTVRTPAFILRPGVNEIDRAAYSNARFTFDNNNIGLTVSQTARFPEGEYEYCFEVDISDSKNPQLPPVFENCFVSQLQPRTPLLLINPVDGDEFCNQRPQFMWQLPVPLPRDARCRLVLTTVNEKQDIVEAISFNAPVVNQGNIPGNTLFYPANAPALEEGKQYAWQVIVYVDKSIIARSEVWTFTSKCNEDPKIVSTDSYRELKEVNDGNYYVANRYLRFSLTNPYAAGNLRYTITGMDNPSEPVKGLPDLKIAPGLNKFDIDLSDNRNFKNDKEYLLTVWLASNRSLSLRFIYKSDAPIP